MSAHKEREAFQDTISVLRDSLQVAKADIARKTITTDSTLSKIKGVLYSTLKDRDKWRASSKAVQARLDTLKGDDYRQAADSLISDMTVKQDSLFSRIEELTVDTEALTGQLEYERESRNKAMNLMQQQIDKFEVRNQQLEKENEELRKQKKRGKVITISLTGVAFLLGLLAN